MTTRAFGRKIRLEIGKPGELASVFSDHRIAFDVEMTSDGTPNTANIELYNSAPGLVRIMQEKNTVVRLFAGYTHPGRIFQGRINRDGAHEIKNGVDRILKIEATDGGRELIEARLDLTFSAETTASEMLNLLVETLGIPVGSIVLPTNDITIAQGMTLSGPLRDQLDQIAEAFNCEHSIQDGEFYFVSKRATTLEEVVIVSSINGNLIGTPTESKEGVEFKSLLDHRIRPHRRVVLKADSAEATGTFKVTHCRRVGDLWGPQWYSVCKAKRI